MDSAEDFTRAYYRILTEGHDSNGHDIDDVHEGVLMLEGFAGNHMSFVDATGFVVTVTVEVSESEISEIKVISGQRDINLDLLADKTLSTNAIFRAAGIIGENTT